MEIVLELLWEFLVQVVFEFLGEVLVDAGFDGARWVARRWWLRSVVLAAIGLLGGLAWGEILADRGRTAMPRTFWVSLAIAGAGLALLARRVGAGDGTEDDAVLAPPWRWGARRLIGFVLLSAAIAAGVAIGFDPHGA